MPHGTAWLTGESSERDSIYRPSLTAVMKQGAHFSGKAKGPSDRMTTFLEVMRAHSDRGKLAYEEDEYKDELELKNFLLTTPKEQMALALKKLTRKYKVVWNDDYAGKKSAPQSKVPEPTDAEASPRPPEVLKEDDPSS